MPRAFSPASLSAFDTDRDEQRLYRINADWSWEFMIGKKQAKQKKNALRAERQQALARRKEGSG